MMRSLRILGAVAGSIVMVVAMGCGGGASPEVYDVAIDYVRIPDSCYIDSKSPNPQTIVSNQNPARWRIWDGPDNKAYLEVGASGSVPMGNAQAVPISGTLEGTKGQKDWSFTTTRVVSDKPAAVTYPITTTTKAIISFERGTAIKGTMRLESSRVCDGGCVNDFARLNPTCTIDGIGFRATRVAVTYWDNP